MLSTKSLLFMLSTKSFLLMLSTKASFTRKKFLARLG